MTLPSAKQFKISSYEVHKTILRSEVSFCILVITYNLAIIYILEPAYRLFTRDEDDWCAQGHYESIINRTPTPEDYVTWMTAENGMEFICVLGVS
jgi:hypothetical protein